MYPYAPPLDAKSFATSLLTCLQSRKSRPGMLDVPNLHANIQTNEIVKYQLRL